MRGVLAEGCGKEKGDIRTDKQTDAGTRVKGEQRTVKPILGFPLSDKVCWTLEFAYALQRKIPAESPHLRAN